MNLSLAVSRSRTLTAMATIVYHGHKFVLFAMHGQRVLITPRFAEGQAYSDLVGDMEFLAGAEFARWAECNVDWEPSNPYPDGLTLAIEGVEQNEKEATHR